MTVRIRFNGAISETVRIRRGTRQGGLTSPYLFNLIYVDMISALNKLPCGITINNVNYNVFCYADDVMLFKTLPIWTMDGHELKIQNQIKYLGAIYDGTEGNSHTRSQIRAAQRAFYTLHVECRVVLQRCATPNSSEHFFYSSP